MLSVVVIFVLLVSASDWLGRSVFCTSPVICCVIVSKMTYNVLSGMLNPAIPYHTINISYLLRCVAVTGLHSVAMV